MQLHGEGKECVGVGGHERGGRRGKGEKREGGSISNLFHYYSDLLFNMLI